DAPNLLFTNAGMNQFVPIFLGQANCPYTPGRAADTQKCIRAGGKHNDLDDVGMDTYHHTFFEMLGNWSFGDYFKEEAVDWSWELITKVWGLPESRIYATYFGGDEKSEADLEAKALWERFLPAEQVVPGNRKDNFWMMGDTGPCGPCSELHIDLTPEGNCGPGMVNVDSADCIEIWNLVFIQFNANVDGSFSSLPAKHVDTGMGFERICSIMQCTDGFKDFSGIISNYETDVFAPIFRKLEEMSGKTYNSSMTDPVDVAFRVIADHVRCLAFSIADGIIPSNEGRGYVLRRILRRAVRYGRALGFQETFFYKLADVVFDSFGDVFPELRKNHDRVSKTLKAEEESFNRTLDRGIFLFEKYILISAVGRLAEVEGYDHPEFEMTLGEDQLNNITFSKGGVAEELTYEELKSRGWKRFLKDTPVVSGDEAFKLYDTYGFPVDLTEVMAREYGLTVDAEGFEQLMNEQRERARADHAAKKSVVLVESEGLDVKPTAFVGFDNLESEAVVEAVTHAENDEYSIVLDKTPCYAEMGGQLGDHGMLTIPGHDDLVDGTLKIIDTQKQGELFVHRAKLVSGRAPEPGEGVLIDVDAKRRSDIQCHHTATHLFHWALHEVVSTDARQRGSLVADDRMRFDFNSPEKLTDDQVAAIEKLINDRIESNEPVYWSEVPFSEVQQHSAIQQFFGEKYGDTVRVLQIGGGKGSFDGFSMELCGGCHAKNTGELGLFKIMSESSIAAGIRRIEAACGTYAERFIEEQKKAKAEAATQAAAAEEKKKEAKKRQAELQAQAPAIAEELLGKIENGLLVENMGEADAGFLSAIMDVLHPQLQSTVAILGGTSDGKVGLVCAVTPDLVKEGKNAGKI
ncbi:MAG: alanine--tRNA ligase, partial [Kiritimatiellaceae bacterium]|nr:alanine--tRNA ligase [Kiritimatiellaceae bacterium]